MEKLGDKIATWRKLCIGNNSFGADALREACDALETYIVENELFSAFIEKKQERIAVLEAALVRELSFDHSASKKLADDVLTLLAENGSLKEALAYRQVFKMSAADREAEINLLRPIADAVNSVAHEDTVRESLLCFNMGIVLLSRLAALDAHDKAKA